VQDVFDVPQEGVLVGRGLGVLDMARAIRDDRSHIATGRFGYHVLDTLLAIEEAAETRTFVNVESTIGEVGALPADFDPHAATL
jgi:hypothetical protein